MNTVGSYFVTNSKDATCKKENIVLGKKYRISILTDRLVRLEYSENGIFEDRPTSRVIFRNFDKVNYTTSTSETLIQITTSYLTINYVMEKSFEGSKIAPGNTLKITLNNTDRSWYYHHPEARNFGTINYSLDDYKGKLKLAKGLYSTDGFAYIDDSDSLVLNSNGNFVSRTNKEMDLYVFVYRKDLGLCLRDYYQLTGQPQLIPRYALGNWWFKNEQYNNIKIAKTITKFKEAQIPISVFMLGNKWHSSSDPTSFDQRIINPMELKQILTKNNIKLGLTIDPSTKIEKDAPNYQTFSSLLKEENPSFIPVDNNKINTYSNYVILNLLANGVDVFNVDYNNLNDKITLSLFNHYHYAIDSLKFNRRSLVLTRNHNIAIHRYGIINTGRTTVDWETLSILPLYNASASNMGISYIANAIGGFYKGIEDFELYIRYIQFGTFSPLLVLASDGGRYYRREPWRFSTSKEEIIKKYLTLRNKLIPYIYTEAYIYHKNGSPIVQPLYYKYPKIYDEPLYINQYFFGSQFLICPITKPKNKIMNRVVQRIFIPEGTWYEFESGKKYLGNKYYMSFYKDDDYPVFCKEGSIIVMSLDFDTNNPQNLEVDIFPGANGEYNLYEDDGISNNYKIQTGATTNYTFNYSKDQYELLITPQGSLGLVPNIRSYTIKFRNTQASSITVTDGINNIPATANLEANDLIIKIPNVQSGQTLKITCSGNNIENSTIRLINDDIKGILEDLEIETILKEKIDNILFSNLTIKKKRIAIRKLKRKGLEPKFIKMFISLLEYIETV